MDPLAVPLDVAERLGRELTTVEGLRVEALIKDASAKVRSLSTQMFTLVENDEVVLPISPKRRVRLPQRPVVSVASVTDINDNALTYRQVNEWLYVSSMLLNAWEVEPWHCPIREVNVTYTHGGDVPDDILAVVCAAVGRALGSDPTESGTFQETIDGYSIGTSVTMATVLAQGGLGLLASEIEVCRAYVRPGLPIPMMM